MKTVIVRSKNTGFEYAFWFDDDQEVPERLSFTVALGALPRRIMKTPKGMECDHISGDRFDLRKQNMRNVTPAQNKQNVGKNRWANSLKLHKVAPKVQESVCFLLFSVIFLALKGGS